MKTLHESAKPRWLIVSLLALSMLLPGSCDKSFAQDSEQSAVVLTVSEADSLLNLVDDLDLQVRLLNIDLRETRHIAAIDSSVSAEKARLTEEAHQFILDAYKDAQPGFVERFLKQPVIWLALGVYLGLQAP